MSSSDSSDSSDSEREREKRARKREKKARKKEKKARKKEKKELRRRERQAAIEQRPGLPVVVCTSAELEEGGCRLVELEAGEVSVWRLNGAVHAISNRCPHKRARLSLGDLEDLGQCEAGRHLAGGAVAGPCVRCPKHRGKFGGGLYFSLIDGQSFTKVSCSAHRGPESGYAVNTFPVSELDGQVVLMPSARPSASMSLPRQQLAGKAVQDQTWTVSQVESAGPIRVLVARTARPMLNHYDGGMPLWHVSISDADVIRDYTPISTLSAYAAGEIRLLIKVYRDGELTSRVFSKIAPGDALSIGPPEPTLSPAQSHALWQSQAIGLVAGGTGLTPIVMALLHAKHLDIRQVWVVCSSSTAEEASCAMRFVDEVQHPSARVSHTLTNSQPPAWWRGFNRRLDASMLMDALPLAGPETRVLLSGPTNMMSDVQSILESLGHVPSNIIKLDA